MSSRRAVGRRSLLKMAGAGAGALALTGVSARAEEGKGDKSLITFRNQDFYKNGKFDVEAGKDAVMRLIKYHGYPELKGLRENLWVSDYGLGQFTSVGLAARIFVNNEADRYMMLDIYLLPGQMLAEHWHVATEKNPAKREGWLVRHGMAHIVGEGEPNLGADVVIPKVHMNGTAKAMHDTVARPGDFVPLARVETRHWQLAGPEGAIVTEVANVHDNAGVRHSEPKIVF